MIFVDTAYLIGLAEPRDQLHQRSLLWAGHVNEPLLVTEYVLIEVVNHFSAPRDRPRVGGLMQILQRSRRFSILWSCPALFDAGLRLHRARPDKEWSLTDCISFHVMQERGIRHALAYDIHFEQAGFDPLLRREPPL